MRDHAISAARWVRFFTDLLSHRTGRRGAALICIGIGWVFFGLGVALAPPPVTFSSTPPDLRPVPIMYLFEIIPLPIRVALWIGTGLVAIVAAFRRGPGKDGFGFIALSIMPTTRVIGYFWSWITWMVGIEGGNQRGWVSGSVWAVMIVLILIISGWAEVPRGSAPERSAAELDADRKKES